MFPQRPVTRKNPLPKQSPHTPKPLPDPKVLEVRSEKRLHVLRLLRHPQLLAHRHDGIRVTYLFKPSHALRKQSFGFEIRDLALEVVVADDALGLRRLWCGFAAMRAGEEMVLDECGEKFEGEEGKGAQSEEYYC